MVKYSIGQVAKIAGISTRTLRHYDNLGLLPPASVGSNGYRWYGRSELRTLQRILLLRDLRVPLSDIVALLSQEHDEASALRRHLVLIRAERDRLDRVASLISTALRELEGQDTLADADFFEGLQAGRAQLAATLVQRFGPAATTHLDSTTAQTSAWTRGDYDQAAAGARELYGRFSRARKAHVHPTSPEALDLVAEHHEAILATWPADPAAYHALADLIESDPQQRGPVADADPDLPSWLAAAVRAFATTRLGHRPGELGRRHHP